MAKSLKKNQSEEYKHATVERRLASRTRGMGFWAAVDYARSLPANHKLNAMARAAVAEMH